ncbi:MAG: DUF5605 domain-containing protein [Oscillospiraceae bacterium]|jgi:hypothetical protein|nr:DUF5605 domain-containing protein [Oscillospiraceae bacterium]
MTQIPKYGRFELSFIGPSGGNPFMDTTLSATFRYKNRCCEADGFYDGGGVYKLRFMPTIEGEWEYVTASNIPEMDGQTGAFTCIAALPGAHGPVRVKDKFHFAYDDGTPFYPFGTTAYNWTNQATATVEQTLKTLAAAPFNKIRMSPLPKHYLYNSNEPLLYPFDGGMTMEVKAEEFNSGSMFSSNASDAYKFDFTRLNPAFFRDFEKRIEQLGEIGVEADMILFHPYDRWGFSNMPEEASQLYLKYIIARLASYPNIWWSMANEWDLLRNRTIAEWEDFASTLVERDPSQHLRSIHNCINVYDHSAGWITHVSWQRIDYHSHVELTAKLRDQWQKPVLIDEIAYEGNIDQGWGNISGEEMVKRFWDVTVRGGYCTHGETYLRDDENLWWAKGGELIGTSPARIAFLRKIVEDMGYIDAVQGPMDWDLPWGLAGKKSRVETKTAFGTMSRMFSEDMICYFSFSQPKFRNFYLPDDMKYKVYVIDTWEMTVTALDGEYCGGARIDLPGKPGIAVRFKKA